MDGWMGWDGVSVGVGCNPTGLFYDYILRV